MLRCKELKGTASEPNVDKAINDFFDQCSDGVSVLNMYYSTVAVPFKTQIGAVSYKPVSSCLIFYDEHEEE